MDFDSFKKTKIKYNKLTMNNTNNIVNNANSVNNLINNVNVVNNNQALIIYNNIITDINSNEQSETIEAFPWLFDREGKAINYTDNVNIFEAIELISHFLETKFKENPEKISTVKISEFIEIFDIANKKVTVLELYNHVSSLYKKDKEFLNKAEELLNANYIADESDEFKPFGSIGDIPFTLNQICNNLKDLKWEGIINSSRITINVVPVCANLIGYGVLMRGYVKHVYKQPLLPNLTEVERKNELLRRNRNLALFGLLGAPLTLCLLKV